MITIPRGKPPLEIMTPWYHYDSTSIQHSNQQSATVGTLTILPSQKSLSVGILSKVVLKPWEFCCVASSNSNVGKPKPSKHENWFSMPDSDNQPNASRFITKSKKANTFDSKTSSPKLLVSDHFHGYQLVVLIGAWPDLRTDFQRCVNCNLLNIPHSFQFSQPM